MSTSWKENVKEKHTCSRSRCSPDMHKKRTEWCAVFWKVCNRMGHAPWNIYLRIAAHAGVQTLCCNFSHVGMILCFLQYYSVHLRVFVTTLRTRGFGPVERNTGSSFSFPNSLFFLLLRYWCYLLWAMLSEWPVPPLQWEMEESVERLNIYSGTEEIKIL